MKNVITKEQTKDIAKLANIKITDMQAENLSESISSVIAYMEEIKDLDLENIPETARVTEEINVFREDRIEPSFSQEEALYNAKKTHNGFIVVPYVFEQKEE